MTAGGKEVEQLLKEMQEPGEEDVIGITEQLVDQAAAPTTEASMEMLDGQATTDSSPVKITDQVECQLFIDTLRFTRLV